MPAPQKKKTAEFKLALPQAAFPVVMFANEVGLEWLAGAALVHFGCLTSVGVMASFATLIDRETLEREQDNWATYLGKMAIEIPTTTPSFRCPHGTLKGAPAIANLILWSQRADAAEIRFYTFSMGEVTQVDTKPKPDIIAQPLGLIQLRLVDQLHILSSLLAHGE